LSPAAFSRFFRRLTGRTCAAWLQELRLGRACDQLASSDRGIAVIAAEAGFRSMTNFNRTFRRLRGATPRAWRATYGSR
ncbi:MAG: helix-turn-helix transcriptional regulator, partial [Planctomycetes bacterium]|nr:helix-turn-helix transcriptional regulator [Planctomycetota bacterium]